MTNKKELNNEELDNVNGGSCVEEEYEYKGHKEIKHRDAKKGQRVLIIDANGVEHGPGVILAIASYDNGITLAPDNSSDIKSYSIKDGTHMVEWN